MSHAQELARTIATTALGRDPGPLTAVESRSHQVFLAADVVVKVIDPGQHTRLDREIALVPHLPAGLTAPLLSSGVGDDGSRYASYARVPGVSPGMDLPGVDVETACSLAAQAVRRLGVLHSWVPGPEAERILRDPLDHGGFINRAGLFALIEGISAVLTDDVVAGLSRIAEGAPMHAGEAVPVHADSHWGNWLAADGTVTALLDFEWARYGDPLDDWFFVISSSGRHREAVLDVVARETGTPPDLLRYECEVRHATHLASDIQLAVA